MSDFDFGDDHGAGHDTGNEHDSLNHAENSGSLDQLHQEHGSDNDSLHQNQAYGSESGYEDNSHFADGHQVNYDNAHTGEHFSSTDYTEADTHSAGYQSEYGESSLDASHDSQHSELDSLRAHFEQELTEANHSYDGAYGQSELSAVSK